MGLALYRVLDDMGHTRARQAASRGTTMMMAMMGKACNDANEGGD